MATTTYGTEYVQSSDLVSNWPGSSLSVANRIDNVSLVGNGYNNQTGTSYTLVLTDGGKLVTFSNAAAVALTVPTNASVAFPTGVRVLLTNKGAGTVTVAGAGGVTVNGNQLTIAQNRSAELYKLDVNTWVMTADASIPSDPGLAFVTANTFSASSAVNVNNCFTSTYDNYRIVLSLDSVSTALALLMRMRVSGVDNASANYYFNGPSTETSSATAVTTARSVGLINQFNVFFADTNGSGNVSLDVYNPARAVRTMVTYMNIFQNATDMRTVALGGLMSVTTAYDGFSLVPSTGTVTGSVRVYGYRNS